MDTIFLRARGTQVEKNHGNCRGCVRSAVKPPGTENPEGWGVKLEK